MLGVAVESDALELSMSELRVVASYAAEAAQDVLPLFAAAHPDDLRPRAAVDAAQAFARGAHRSNLQRSTSLQAHRAAKQARTPVARHAAHAAGDAAAAAYLHPIPRATQVGHILRAAAHAACAVELDADGDADAAQRYLDVARRRAAPGLVDVLVRYPPAPTGSTRVAALMKELDTALRRG
jgi:hypothetical protein